MVASSPVVEAVTDPFSLAELEDVSAQEVADRRRLGRQDGGVIRRVGVKREGTRRARGVVQMPSVAVDHRGAPRRECRVAEHGLELLVHVDLLLLDERLQASRLLKRVAAGGQAEDQQRVVKADRPDQPAAVVSVLVRLDINDVIPDCGNEGGLEITGRRDQRVAGKRFRQNGMKKGVTIR